MHSNDLEQSVTPAVTASDAKPSRKGIGGAPRGNSNRFQHGLRSMLTIGGVPKGCGYIRRVVGALDRNLHELATVANGSLSPIHIATINRITRYELVALYATRELRERGDQLSLSDRMSLWSTLTNATEARDKALAKLGLDKAPGASEASWPDPEADTWQVSPDGIHEVASTRSTASRSLVPEGRGVDPVSPQGPPENTHQQGHRPGALSDSGARPAATGEHSTEGEA